MSKHPLLKFLLISAAAHGALLIAWPQNQHVLFHAPTSNSSLDFSLTQPNHIDQPQPSARKRIEKNTENKPSALNSSKNTQQKSVDAPAKQQAREPNNNLFNNTSAPKNRTAPSGSENKTNQAKKDHAATQQSVALAAETEETVSAQPQSKQIEQLQPRRQPRRQSRQQQIENSEVGNQETPQARTIFSSTPNYPKASIRKGQQGLVIVHLKVKTNGEPFDIALKKSSGYYLLDNSVVKFIKRTKFQPRTLTHNKDIPTQEYRFQFVLNQN